MNVYDGAHSLANAIKESEEFIQFDNARKELETKPELSEMIRDFQGKQIEFQTKQMLGQETSPEYMQELTRLSAVIMQDPMAADYMAKEMRFAMMMQDVYGILNDATNLMPGGIGGNNG